jgi:AcrR family transcriptional regulator
MSVTTRTLLGREERRDSILRGAAAAFATGGFDSTSMEDVAAATGITKLIVYRHFGSKEELYRAVLEQVSGRLVEEFVVGAREARPALGYRTLLTVARENPDGFVLLWRHASHEPSFAEYARAFRSHAVKLATSALAGAFATRPALARWAPEAIIDEMVSSVLAWLAHGDPADDEEFLTVATAGRDAMVRAWTG